jgi:hypothetical protein
MMWLIAAAIVCTIGLIVWLFRRPSNLADLGSVSGQWLAEYRQDHGW